MRRHALDEFVQAAECTVGALRCAGQGLLDMTPHERDIPTRGSSPLIFGGAVVA
jgi:hypothetical protein